MAPFGVMSVQYVVKISHMDQKWKWEYVCTCACIHTHTYTACDLISLPLFYYNIGKEGSLKKGM